MDEPGSASARKLRTGLLCCPGKEHLQKQRCVCGGAGRGGDAHRICKEQILLPPPVLQPVSSSPCWQSLIRSRKVQANWVGLRCENHLVTGTALSFLASDSLARLSTDLVLHFQKVFECCASHRESSLLEGFRSLGRVAPPYG